MVLTLDVLLHEAEEKNFKRKIIKSAFFRFIIQEYLLKKILRHKSIIFLSSLPQNHQQNLE